MHVVNCQQSVKVFKSVIRPSIQLYTLFSASFQLVKHDALTIIVQGLYVYRSLVKCYELLK